MAQNLLALQQQVAAKKQLEAKLSSLQQQWRVFDQKVTELKVIHREEQADVEKLEGSSLANYFYRFVGKLDGMLDEERQQAAQAGIKLESAQRELAAIDEEITQIRSQLRALANCETAYQTALAEKRAALKASGTGEQILESEARITELKSQKKEIAEARSAGEKAACVARSILSKLSKADDWNTFDLWGGSSAITHIAKHSHLDDAQNLVYTLQEYLRQFTTELADVRMQTQLQVNIDGFWRFADYFFDGLFVDWKIREQITQSQDAVTDVVYKVDGALRKLQKLEQNADKEIAALQAKIKALVLNG